MRHVTVVVLPESKMVQICGPDGVQMLKPGNPIEVGLAVMEQLTSNRIRQERPYRRSTDIKSAEITPTIIPNDGAAVMISNIDLSNTAPEDFIHALMFNVATTGLCAPPVSYVLEVRTKFGAAAHYYTTLPGAEWIDVRKERAHQYASEAEAGAVAAMFNDVTHLTGMTFSVKEWK